VVFTLAVSFAVVVTVVVVFASGLAFVPALALTDSVVFGFRTIQVVISFDSGGPSHFS
jgi:hypothetical protein